ncbi:cation diffusion facilitator family transporter [Histidinibacterium aquaticum]|uniref:Cation transporter n=1 Tax=Histidinibacterium aquaticum TaxID=2613962 RepID=A0A5J5GCU4_9RHOB|nr:cation diffusion facilitator family transporter [Histidinibacterium aquaticum]KAA9005996.1 cation transporter [Histidinibacterium aquaticum]
MADCGCRDPEAETAGQRRVLWIALNLNAVMFAGEGTAGLIAHSAGLIADGLDMLGDASAYAIALAAVGRGALFKARAATTSGVVLLCLGLGLLFDVVRRLISGEPPEGLVMIAVSVVALAVNATVLRLLGQYRDSGVHLRATWIFTRVDVVANLAVILSGILVLASGLRHADLVVGGGIGLYVVKEALEILREARDGRRVAEG